MPAQGTSVKNNIKRYGISRSPRTTPKDLGHVLDLLYCGKTFGSDNNKLFIESLLNNIYSNRLPAGVGYKSPVAHKTGSSSSVQPLYRTIAGEVYSYMKKRIEIHTGD